MTLLHAFIAAHLTTMVPALILGPIVLFRPKGTPQHKRLGKTWAYLMLLSSALSFGIQTNGHLSWLHGLAAYTIFAVLSGIQSAKKQNFKRHKRAMIGSYIGSVVAFIFTLRPERVLGRFFFGS